MWLCAAETERRAGASTLADTHRRARQAKADLDALISEVRKAIGEARSLLDQLWHALRLCPAACNAGGAD